VVLKKERLEEKMQSRFQGILIRENGASPAAPVVTGWGKSY